MQHEEMIVFFFTDRNSARFNSGIYTGRESVSSNTVIPRYTWLLDRYWYSKLNPMYPVTSLSVKKNTIIIEGTLADNPNLIHRERFTVGHEASHGLVHPEYYQRKARIASLHDYCGGIYSKPTFPDLSGKDVNGKRLQGEAWLEWQANYLSSVLLMPRIAVKRLRNLIEPKGSRFWHLELIQTMVEVFNVSEEAARVRLVSLNCLPT